MRYVPGQTQSPAQDTASVLAGLDDDQRAAVTAPVGVVVVRAGAGSGKTTVLTRRIAWRVLSETADIERTLAITFTRQAATEMRTRLSGFDLDGRPIIGTFHAIARRIMLQRCEDTNKRPPMIVNNRFSVMSSAMGDDARRGGVADMLNAVDWIQSRMIPLADATNALDAAGVRIPLGATRFVEVVEAYERDKRRRGVVDLNDFLTTVVRDAARDARFAESLRFQFRHVSVDEAQDMNPLQYGFLRALLPAQPDLFLVGDPNQAIYGFNGADKTLFDALPGLSSGASVISLPSNYRCTPEIVSMAVATLAKDGQHAVAASRRNPGAVVRLERCEDEAKERALITKLVVRARAGHRSFDDIAVLVRVNSLVDAISQDLARVGIPVKTGRRGSEWSRAVASAAELTSRDALNTWAADILDTGDYNEDDADFTVAKFIREFLDTNRSGSVDGRAFGTWLATNADTSDSTGVDVLSFHAAKGREWPVVIVAGMEKGLLPHRSARSPESRHEEARLAYVALTRAADELTITWTDRRDGKPTGPSVLLPTVHTENRTFDDPPEEFRRIAARKSSADPVYVALDQWRRRRARLARMEPQGILNTRQMKAIARDLPVTVEQIADVTDEIFANRYGDELLKVIRTSRDR